jgi:hypothetical protein
MCKAQLLFAIVMSLSTVSVLAQVPFPASEGSATAESKDTILAGKWTYRSFHNNPALVDRDPNKALKLIFAEAVFTFDVPSANTLKGTIDWDGGGLDLQGTTRPGSLDASIVFDIVGTGRPGTATAGWEYDYQGQVAHQWPNGSSQVPALVGSVIRAKPHDGAPAGYVASFIAVKQP